VLATWFILNHTLLGRGIYAIGGSEVAAQRAGFNIVAIKFFIYGYVGMLAGLAGVAHVSLARMANPFDIVGIELTVITAVVLGGARISGGHGSVLGTLLGVFLLVLIDNNLILLGIDSTWQRAVFGVLILIGVSMPAIQARLARGGADQIRASG
jgi:simple sugar transport system permease protein